MGSSRLKRGTYAGGGSCERKGYESRDCPLLQPRDGKPNTRKWIYPTSHPVRFALCLVVFLSFILTCHAQAATSNMGYSSDNLENTKAGLRSGEKNGLVNPSASGCKLEDFRRCSENADGVIDCFCMKGYEEAENDKSCKEIVKHSSSLTVEESWDQSYCDKDSDLYKELYDNVQSLFTEAAKESDLSDEFLGFDDMDVFPNDNPDACGSSRVIGRGPHVPLNLTPKNRAKRNVQKVNTKAAESNLVVETEMKMRMTDKYDSSSISGVMEEAVKDVIVNTNFTENMDLIVIEDSVTVGGVKNGTCDDIDCSGERAECFLEVDNTLGAARAKCRCLQQYEDISNPSKPGELCVEWCTRDYCSNSGACLRNATYLTRYCSCDEWKVGNTCGLDMVGVLLGGGIGIGILTIAIFTILITAVNARRRKKRNEVSLENERDINTPVTTTPQIRGIYRLPSDSEVRMEQDPPFRSRLSPPPRLPPRMEQDPPFRSRLSPSPRLPPRPQRVSPEQSLRSDPVPLHRDPRSDVWFVSQNIPRPRLSL